MRSSSQTAGIKAEVVKIMGLSFVIIKKYRKEGNHTVFEDDDDDERNYGNVVDLSKVINYLKKNRIDFLEYVDFCYDERDFSIEKLDNQPKFLELIKELEPEDNYVKAWLGKWIEVLEKGYRIAFTN